MTCPPILLITFNRPKHTERVLQSILQAKVSRLYIFQDGAREGNQNDITKCQQVKTTIQTLTKNQGIEILTYYSDINLGCGAGPQTAISWFFENEPMGIVMEDDCLPHPDFYPYAAQLLQRYKDTPQVGLINATLYHNRWHCDHAYGFSHYLVTGAWAGWRRSWEGFDLDMHKIDARALRKQVYRLTKSPQEADWWYFKTLEIQHDTQKKSYWDYQMQINLFFHGALTIHPKVNLISNIGFDIEATHTHANDGRGDRPTAAILPLTHPDTIAVIDNQTDILCFGKSKNENWWQQTKTRLYKNMLYSDGVCRELILIYKTLKQKMQL